MPFAIIADWDAQFRVSNYNFVGTAAEATAIVNRLLGLPLGGAEQSTLEAALAGGNLTDSELLHFKNRLSKPLPSGKLKPNTYSILMPPAPPGTAGFQHRARFWVADPGNGLVSFDAVACHEWQSRVTGKGLDREAEVRGAKVYSPGAPGRATTVRLNLMARRSVLQDKGRSNWNAAELIEWDAGVALDDRAKALQEAAQTVKDTLDAKTPEEVHGVDPSDDALWPE